MPGTETAITVPAALDPGEAVSVRMYRRILGDCFLLTHTRTGADGAAERFHALIDCGALQRIGALEPTDDKPKGKHATQASLDALGDAIDDLLDHVGGRLDLMIATHEHYDHLSGFMKYFEKFDTLKIDKLWLAWTENKNDELARKIDQGRSRGLAAIAALTERASSFGINLEDDDDARLQLSQISDLLQFYGEIEPLESADFGLRDKKDQTLEATLEPGKRPLSCKQALLWLKQRATEANVAYLEPGQQIAFGLGNRLKASVLGPPRTEARLTQMDPAGKGENKEVYLTHRDEVEALIATMSRQRASHLAAKGAAGEDEEDDLVEFFTPVESELPFAERFSRPIDPDSEERVSRRYYAKGKQDRRIDGDWLGAAEALALKIDDDVNNTSLALAIEVPGRQVLLFPADAQVGNWLSWHDQTYPSKPGVKDPAGETAADILSRVVLYKVGHHGSHNATLRAQGLELMTNPNLAAMIPVVTAVAEEQSNKHNKDGWAMPYDDLEKRLQTKTAGRIVKGDGTPGTEQAAFAGSIFVPEYDPKLPADPCWVSLTLGKQAD